MKVKSKRGLKLCLPALLLAALLLPTTAGAQDRRIGLYAGYTFFNSDDGNLSGLRLSPEYHVNGFASLVADLSSEKGTISSASTTLTTFLGGLRLKRGIGGLGVYAHGLAGGVRSSASVTPVRGVAISVSDTAFAIDGGAGLEFSFRGALRMRIGGDYLRRKVDVGGGATADENDIRATVGFVF